MGYESKLYVVDKHDWKGCDGKWGEIIASFDLCCVPINFAQYPVTDCYIIADDGNTRITEDKYGSPLREIPVKDMIDMIEKEIKADKDYRRYQPCLNLLKGFDLNRWENLIVLHYGH